MINAPNESILRLFLTRRALSTTNKCCQSTRVRFAPSPTGHIHLGGLRAALYNYIFAKQHGGQFVLRIEDTDKTRIVPGAADEIERVLDWAGLRPDESPSVGGPNGPYVQSERIKLYLDKAHELLEQNKAYRCFCSPARLELLRKYQSRNREKPHYDGKCRHLTTSELQEKLIRNGGKHVIRFALSEDDTIFDDLVYGTIKNNLVKSKEGDPIILKSDQFPTYHFANVVDDNSMMITNVIRGAEWISSTAKHIQIYQAFGWKIPQFIHFPLITMADGAKMSKRFDHSHVTEWMNAGYRPVALFNFLTNTGGGVPKSKQDNMELWTLEDFVEGFKFEQITSHAGSLDFNRLKIYGSKDIQRVWSDDPDELMGSLYKLLKSENIRCDLEHDLAKKIMGKLVGRISTLRELLGPDYAFIWRYPNHTTSLRSFKAKGWKLDMILQDTIASVKQVGVDDNEKLLSSLRTIAKQHQVEYPEYMRFLRVILTNNNRGLPIIEIAQCLSEPRFISYLDEALKCVKKIDTNINKG